MSEETDEEILEKLIKAFPFLKDRKPVLKSVSEDQDEFADYNRGRPLANWYDDLVEYVQERAPHDMTIDEACKQFEKERSLHHGDDVTRTRYNELVHGKPHDEFCHAVAIGDIEAAIRLYPRLSRSSRERWGLT